MSQSYRYPPTEGTTPIPVVGTVTADQGTPNSTANAWPVKVTDGTDILQITAAGEATVSVTQPLPTGTNTIGKVNQGTAAPGTGAWPVKLVSSAGTTTLLINGGDGSALVTNAGFIVSDAPVYHNYSATNVTTAAYVQLIASTTAETAEIELFDSSGQALYLATGAAASEVDQIIIFPGGNGRVKLFIPAGKRVSVKAITATASVGFLALNLYAVNS